MSDESPPRAVFYLIVFVQILCPCLLIFTMPLSALSLPGVAVIAASALLLFWAVAAMRFGRFNITPAVNREGRFTTSGPYAFIRHPMYSAELLFVAALVLDYFYWWRLLVWSVLLIDIMLKVHYEEQILRARFKDYSAYRNRTKRFIPFVY